ncbi:MAG: GNAT family N-acetyltransferase [Rhizobiales bacterium]|nr:GNAT family N-acetyltransferase [Hyphomicrobiales bacterium]
MRELQTHESQFYDRMKPAEEMNRWYIQRLKDDIAKHKGAFLVAEADQTVVGYATLLTEVSSENERDEILYTCAYVGDLAVTKSRRGQGVGHALLSECEKLARAAGQKWMRLGVHVGNREARAFYARAGLEEKFLTLEKPLK